MNQDVIKVMVTIDLEVVRGDGSLKKSYRNATRMPMHHYPVGNITNNEYVHECVECCADLVFKNKRDIIENGVYL